MTSDSSTKNMYLGNTPLSNHSKEVTGDVTVIDGVAYFKILNFDQMPPFFMTLVSDNNQWLFLGSNGGITAGRKNSEHALFPYYTDDKLLDNASNTGSTTLFRINKEDKSYLWEPFVLNYSDVYSINRNIYKSKFGNSIIFEEINHDLGLTFSYRWCFSGEYGFVRKCSLSNQHSESISIDVLDGIRNILPAGIDTNLQANRSTLVDAYKKNELDAKSGLGIFTLSSRIVDRAEPSEALEATTVWSKGLQNPTYCTSANQIEAFKSGQPIHQEAFTKAVKAAYLTYSEFTIDSKTETNWTLVAEVNQSTAEVFELQHALLNNASILTEIDADVKNGSNHLRKLVGIADGHQTSNDFLASARHYSNVMFNIMRGGTYENGYAIKRKKYTEFIHCWNQSVFNQFQAFFKSLPEQLPYEDLLEKVEAQNNADLTRLTLEFLPLSFSRRHGDPSRPWNYFNIDIYDENNEKQLSYEGNWRDIFQNWEALTFSFPEYIFGIISKFLNASTIDGYNPYRITNEGIDWEVIEPNDPWSYIGYWGDHQIIYLQKLLEIAEVHYPGQLEKWMNQSLFVYANVPYRIRTYREIKINPYDTVDFDHDTEQWVENKVGEVGADGKFVWSNPGSLLKANLFEKLLLTLLTKMYNFVPDGGIWLNTQRPEWNDANNALVGHGTSLVTLHYIRRYVLFLQRLIKNTQAESYPVSAPLAALQHAVGSIFYDAQNHAAHFTPEQREVFIDNLGLAGETYRTEVYSKTAFDTSNLKAEEVSTFLSHSLVLIDATLANSKRNDGLYHAYNLLEFDEEGAKIKYLYEMLEGQVAALSSGFLSVDASKDLLNALKKSAMYREDQYSYMLYPDRDLPAFLAKNSIPQQHVEANPLIQYLLKNSAGKIVEQSKLGSYHFTSGITNFKDVKGKIEELADSDEALKQLNTSKNTSDLEAVFEKLFDHQSFTGRSGTFYGYEGLGSIYWHMVSKLLLGVQETVFRGYHSQADSTTLGELIDHYYEIRAGIGINKSPELYGAFPTDPYSHTPGNAGAQQPGMTGQVKEDVLNRWAELGLRIFNGTLRIEPVLFNKNELLKSDEDFHYYDVQGQAQTLSIQAGSMAFTYAGIPFIYTEGSENQLKIHLTDGEVIQQNDLMVPTDLTQAIFKRNGAIQMIKITIP